MKRYILFMLTAILLAGCNEDDLIMEMQDNLNVDNLYADNEVSPYYCDSGILVYDVADAQGDIISIERVEKVVGVPTDCNETNPTQVL